MRETELASEGPDEAQGSVGPQGRGDSGGQWAPTGPGPSESGL